MNDNNLHVRMATPADTEKLLTIYELYVLETAITFEHVVPTVEEFRERIVHTLTRSPYLAMVQDGKIVGYAYVSPSKLRATYDQTVGTSIYVDKTCRDGGVGTRLYKALEGILRQQNILNLEACTIYPSPESIRFHEEYGYKTMAHFTECGYKMEIWYGMIQMKKMLGGHPKESAPVIPIISRMFKNLL